MSTAILAIPPLRHGERLSREEFERRYEAMPDVKAELLDGVVYMSSPVTAGHSTPHGHLMWWLVSFEGQTPGVESGDNGSIRLPLGSEPQPDAHLCILESHGGRSHIDEDNYVAGVPDLLGEVAKSSLCKDKTVKMPIYRKNGVREYILWRVEDRAIDWYVLRNDAYEELVADAEGIIRSETFPGLWLDVEALIRRDIGSLQRVLQNGINSPEHARFVAELQAAQRAKA